jgi:hypothetical protein
MPDDPPTAPFAVTAEGDRFKVVDAEGRTQVVCADSANADQYAALMNQSYDRGFKAGYRHARRGST